MHNNNKSTRTLGTGCRKWSYKLDANPVRRKRQSGFWFASIDNFDFIHQNLEWACGSILNFFPWRHPEA
jgi:hypothetical protein